MDRTVHADPLRPALPGTQATPGSQRIPAAEELGETLLLSQPPRSLPALPRFGLAGGPGDEFQVVQTLGGGGMGTVDAARQRSLEREVALKRVRDAGNASALTALVREARVMGALEHPNIVPVHALGLDEQGRPVLVMKRIEGVSWSELLAKPDHPSFNDLLARHGDRLAVHVEILQRVCDALEMAHARGVIHRDIKPSNVMIGPFGEVYLVDWGIATTPKTLSEDEKVTGHLVGTPAYMAPEMLAGEAAIVDARTDIYLLGATLHKVLTGKAPHLGPMIEALGSAAESKAHEYGPEVPEDLAALCSAAMSRDPSDRPKSVREVRSALADHLRNRHARALVAASAKRLAEIRDAGEGALAEYGMFRELLGCRFGFLEAQRSMPGSAAAREGLQGCLRLLAKREIALGNPVAARSFVDELEQTDAALAGEIEALRREVAREARLRAEIRQEDPAPSALSRWRLVLVLLAGSILAAATLVLRVPAGTGVPWPTALALDLFVLSLFPISALWIGKKLFVNRMARRFFAMGFCALVGDFAGDVCGVIRGWDPVASALHGHLVLGTCLAISAVSGGRLLWIAAGVMFAGAAVDVARPELHAMSMATTMLVCITLLVVWARRHLREVRDPAPATA